jgi:DNA-binding transcriptional ArsR family regulator
MLCKADRCACTPVQTLAALDVRNLSVLQFNHYIKIFVYDYQERRGTAMKQGSAVGAAHADVGQLVVKRVTGGAEAQLSATDADLYARFFHVLSDPTRMRLLHLLLEAPEVGRMVSELVAAMEAPQGRISTHLGCLRWCGFVQPYREGKYVYYRIADPRVRALLVIGGAMLRDHAAGIASCGIIR